MVSTVRFGAKEHHSSRTVDVKNRSFPQGITRCMVILEIDAGSPVPSAVDTFAGHARPSKELKELKVLGFREVRITIRYAFCCSCFLWQSLDIESCAINACVKEKHNP